MTPPSSVRSRREASPSPMARTTARRASKASTSRNSSSPAPGGETFRQLRPPSVVRSTVPLEPAAQAVLRSTAASPRKRASVPVGVSCQPAAAVGVSPARAGAARLSASAAPISPTDIVRLVFPMDVMAPEASAPGRSRPGCVPRVRSGVRPQPGVPRLSGMSDRTDERAPGEEQAGLEGEPRPEVHSGLEGEPRPERNSGLEGKPGLRREAEAQESTTARASPSLSSHAAVCTRPSAYAACPRSSICPGARG
ncbi:hypothetical protein SNARM312S_01470 [Streptomyces narbonensis]